MSPTRKPSSPSLGIVECKILSEKMRTEEEEEERYIDYHASWLCLSSSFYYHSYVSAL